MFVSLIGCFSDVIIYGLDTYEGDVEIKFIEYTHLPDSFCSVEILKYRDFKYGYRALTTFEEGIYGNFVYCRIGGNLYKIDICNRTYEITEMEFCGVCFMNDYILIAKDYPREKYYKIVPPNAEMIEIEIHEI